MSSSAWVICFVYIRFDLDVGPLVECVAPSDALTDEGKKVIMQVAFPDCNPKGGHDLIFFFQMKDCTTASARHRAEAFAAPRTGRTSPNIYGATYYRQKKDASVPRGYVQQAIVLLSRLPYMAVQELILRVVAPRFCQCCPLSPDIEKVPVLSALSPQPTTFFEVDSSFNPSQYSQKDVIERAVEEIEGWPSPHPHVQYNLTLLHQPLTFVTPKRYMLPSNMAGGATCRIPTRLDERVTFLGSKHQSSSANDVIPLYALLSEHLRHLTRVWELILCHEPLFIWSNTPSMASAVAIAVASLVQPLNFNGILRSYLTVQDESFSRYSRMGKAIPFPTLECIIVAATNPFFFRAFDGWPNLLTVIDRQGNGLENQVTLNDCPFSSGTGDTVAVSTTNSNSTSAFAAAPSNHASVPTDSVSLSKEDGRTLSSPRLFTYSNFFPALAAAKKKTPLYPDPPSGESGGESPLPFQQSVNMFRSSFPFLVDHKAQTSILLHRLEQASHLNAEAQLASLGAHTWNGCGELERIKAAATDTVDRGGRSNSAQPFFQFSIADDIVRKFFDTLTMEFLRPVGAWFQTMISTLTVFHLCDPVVVAALTPDSFLNFLRDNRESVPSFLSRRPHKAYNVMYERFARGSLFNAVVWQLVDKKIRQGLEEIHVEQWALTHPTEVERIEMFTNLYKLVEREVVRSIDPDVVFVTTAIAILAGMVVYIHEPLRDELLLKVRELRI
ncbi:hypothetical protein TraAM80_07525 [Trypanosoma rangeli]|uniref:UDENN domain-containing protein n=1 Tax=Trypanosoma rangeli TaxID=5698 RepID=A0A3R7M6U6_TRYRA|nr:uncharacterized protein TraAM80_07525 [Trypanosoma rangeli]RNF00524.1 hypothetical protein TraAM80_07525 [Trypanosoma rangeli]|eukprot:RNF00524.1 hypothetical protein TraAM80_07525 [Trypanosoma rangeli]